MQVYEQDFLRLVENNKTLVSFDIEALNLRGDYGTVVCASFKPYGEDPYTLEVKQVGNDSRLVKDIKDELEKYDAWVTYYGKGFDIPMVNTRLLWNGVGPVDKRPHIDLYYTLKSNTNTSRRSQGHLMAWLGLETEKMTVSASVWAGLAADQGEKMAILRERCESDVTGLEALYDRTKHIIRSIRR